VAPHIDHMDTTQVAGDGPGAVAYYFMFTASRGRWAAPASSPPRRLLEIVGGPLVVAAVVWSLAASRWLLIHRRPHHP